MESYLTEIQTSAQSKTVRTRNGIPPSPSLYFWTHRTTNADVVAMVTTVLATNANGSSHRKKKKGSGNADTDDNEPDDNDPNQYSNTSGNIVRDPKILRSSRANATSSLKVSAYKSPLEHDDHLRIDEHERMNKGLLNERDEFLNILKNERDRNYNLKYWGVVFIQKWWRRFCVFIKKEELYDMLRIRKNVSTNINGFLILLIFVRSIGFRLNK